MNLEQLTIEIRPRRAWEAVDLGLLMARRWWWPMTKVWLLLSLPLFVVLSFFPGNLLWLSYILLWWLKPLFERPLLQILSQAVFNHEPDTRSTLKAFATLAGQQLIASLTWRRLSPSRSMDFPVIQLEGLRRQRRRERLDILHREDSLPAIWLSVIGFFLEIFIALGLVALIYLLIPEEVHFDQTQLFNSGDALWIIIFFCYFLALAAIAPFFVACGFSLYLNRRIKLEAWDIDIAFRRIAIKRAPAHNNIILAVLLTIIFTAGAGQSPQAMADPAPQTVTLETSFPREPQAPFQRTSAKAAIEEVLAGEDFHQKKAIRYPSFSFGEEKKENPDSEFWKWVFGLFKSADKIAQLATGMELLLWTAFLCLIFLVVFRYRHWLAAYLPLGSPARTTRTTPVTLFGLNLTRESLPNDVSDTALKLWRKGEQRAALALLYRASLSRMLEHGLEIDDGHTEEECLHAAQKFIQQHTQRHTQEHTQAKAAVEYFAILTRAWRRLAYGHFTPDDADAEHLCLTWNDIWDPAQKMQSEGAGRE